jgi:hypothetical protein
LSNGKHAWIQGLPGRWLPLAGFWPSGFHKLDSLDSTKESSKPRSRFRKPLIMSRFSQILTAGGFRLDSPVKVPVASEMLRSAPPYTNRAREEPCQGGHETKASARVRLPIGFAVFTARIERRPRLQKGTMLIFGRRSSQRGRVPADAGDRHSPRM